MLPTHAEDRPARTELPEPEQWLDLYGDALYRYALARLRRPHDAEEAVQDALLAALRGRDSFRGRSQPRSWLFGILHNKIQDRLRAEARRPTTTVGADELDFFFNAHGKWRRPPGRWEDPADLAERDDFWRVVRRCVSRLPASMGAAFTLRTLEELPTAEVCRTLKVTPENFWVLLHRARVRLVGCLQMNWFDNEGR